MFMAGDYQDVMLMSGNVFYTYALQELIYDIKPFLEANPVITAITDANPSLLDVAGVGDALYGLATQSPNLMNLWIRDDWRKQMGIDMPDTMDELVALLKAYQVGDLDGDGTQDIDVIPMTSKNMVYYWDMFAAYFGTKTRIHMVDGNAVDPVVTAEYKDFMDFMKMLYDEELLYQGAPTESSYGNVRTQYYVGEAASILMWADIYDSLTKGLAQNGHADAEDLYEKSAVVPAFDGPNGTFGHGFKHAGSLKSITVNTEYPQEVFDIFFEWYIASDNGIISTTRGLQGYSFDVVDGIMNVLEPGVGYKGQGFPPVNLAYEYPFKFDPITQGEYDYIKSIFADYYSHPMAQIKLVSVINADYTAIVDDWEDAAYGAFWKYVLGEFTHEEYLEAYGKYVKDVGLDTILANIT